MPGPLRTTRLVLLLLAVAIVLSGAVVQPAGLGQQSALASDSGAERIEPSVGEQVGTVLFAADDDVRSRLADAAITGANETRVRAIAARATDLETRARDIRAAYETATARYRNGSLSADAYGRQLAELGIRARNTRMSYAALLDRMDPIGNETLRAAGIDRAALQTAMDRLRPVEGSAVTALTDRYTGGDGEATISTGDADGIEVTVEREDGTRSRQVASDRTRESVSPDDSAAVTQATARDRARAALSDRPWRLVEAETDDGAYEFEFELSTRSVTGEAEVSVDRTSGTVFELEEEVRPRDADDADDVDDADDADDVDDADDADETSESAETDDDTPEPTDTPDEN